jgi:hypothetical protein
VRARISGGSAKDGLGDRHVGSESSQAVVDTEELPGQMGAGCSGGEADEVGRGRRLPSELEIELVSPRKELAETKTERDLQKSLRRISRIRRGEVQKSR